MPLVYIASSLSQHAGGEHLLVLEGSTVEDVLRGLCDRYPGFRKAVFDADAGLRPHIAVFLNDGHISARSNLRTSVSERDEIAIISAIAGGSSIRVTGGKDRPSSQTQHK
jgi:molybdopterin converting factor small subunit